MVTLNDREEILVPFPHGVGRESVPIASSFRSTWLASSLRSLRERGLLARYLTHLPTQYHEDVLTSVAGVWLPTAVATAHYEACERLGLSEAMQLAMGAEVGKYAQGTVFGTAVRLAKGAGVTPWTIMERYPQIWSRVWIGGGVAVYKLGPKDARVEIAGWPCARIPYLRVAMRGVTGGLMTLFCRRAVVTAIPKYCTDLTLGYHFAWA
ncbi:MAG: hypothetical protein ACHREM_17035 [Polyangiales bacterium]